MVFITIVTGAYKPTYILGASHCSFISFYIAETNKLTCVDSFFRFLFISSLANWKISLWQFNAIENRPIENSPLMDYLHTHGDLPVRKVFWEIPESNGVKLSCPRFTIGRWKVQSSDLDPTWPKLESSYWKLANLLDTVTPLISYDILCHLQIPAGSAGVSQASPRQGSSPSPA